VDIINFNSIVVRLRLTEFSTYSDRSYTFQFYSSAIKTINANNSKVLIKEFQFYSSAIKTKECTCTINKIAKFQFYSSAIKTRP
jgi:hypothetical protein